MEQMFTIYSKPNCTFCDQAKALMTQLDLPYHEIVLDIGQEHEVNTKYMPVQEFKALNPTARTVPQIFLDDKLIGGFAALKQHVAA